MNYELIINEIAEDILSKENKGALPDYIPELKAIDPNKFGVSISSIDGQHIGFGDCNEEFSIQSVSKVLSLSMLYSKRGSEIWKRVGVEPSGTAFNSLFQLEADKGIPRNPMINAGAMVICDMLLDEYENAKTVVLEFVRELSGNMDLSYDTNIIESEKKLGFRNAAMINLMKSFNNIHSSIEAVLDLYYSICSISICCSDLAKAFYYLANRGISLDGRTILNQSQTKRINAILQTCGFYDEAGEFSYRVGLPGKSGVGGAIIAIHPEQYSIAVWSPKLNAKGNSYRGLQFLESFTTKTELSIF